MSEINELIHEVVNMIAAEMIDQWGEDEFKKRIREIREDDTHDQ